MGRALLILAGCFCCRVPDPVTALERLQRMIAPEVILAEPVGSCADLIATVLRGLRGASPLC